MRAYWRFAFPTQRLQAGPILAMMPGRSRFCRWQRPRVHLDKNMEPNWSHIGTLAASDYTTAGLLVLLALSLAVLILVLTHLIGPKRLGARKQATYESGMEPIGDTRRRFNVRFYLVAVLFLVFDVEIVFLYPWAVVVSRLRTPEYQSWAQPLLAAGYTPIYLLLAIGLFFLLLLVGLFYEWRRGVFRWN